MTESVVIESPDPVLDVLETAEATMHAIRNQLAVIQLITDQIVLNPYEPVTAVTDLKVASDKASELSMLLVPILEDLREVYLINIPPKPGKSI